MHAPRLNAVVWAKPISIAMQAAKAKLGVTRPTSKAMAWASVGITPFEWGGGLA